MPSRFATYFNEKARPRIWAEHSEVLTLRVGAVDSDLTGVWVSVNPDSTGQDGVGASTYSALAKFTVKKADLPAAPGAAALLIRDDVKWAIREMESKDEYVWILHLAIPNPEDRMPARIRR